MVSASYIESLKTDSVSHFSENFLYVNLFKQQMNEYKDQIILKAYYVRHSLLGSVYTTVSKTQKCLSTLMLHSSG